MAWALLGGAVFSSSCNRSVALLDDTTARGEVAPLENLSFRFNKPLAPDSLLNQWDSTEYIVFNPRIPGRFRWEQADRLVFSPSAPLPPATSFKGILTDALLQYSEYGRIGKADISFSTPELALEDLNVSWVLADEQVKKAVPQLDLYFNYPVAPAAIEEKLSLSVGGKPVDFSLQTLGDDSRTTVRLQGIELQDKDIEATLKLEKGLVPVGGKNGSSKDIRSACLIPSPFNLLVNDIVAQHDGLSGTVLVRVSQQPVMENLSSQIKIEPAVKFSVEPTDEGFAVKSEQFDANKTYRLTLLKGLRGRIGGTLQEQYHNDIAFGELEPSLRFVSNKGVYLSEQGNRMVEMRIVNVPKIKVAVSRIYENNLLAAQRYGYYPKESNDGGEYYYYDDYSDGRNLSLGDVVYEQEIDTRSLPQTGNSRLYKFNIEERLPGFKGIYHIKIRSADNYWVADSRFIALSDLGLIAKEGKDKLYVFINSIKTAEAVSGVNLVAYANNNQAIGVGVTNAEGVAEIAYSEKGFAGAKPAMIVASTGSDFNYLPFSSTKVNTSRFEIGGKRSNPSGLDAFIYAERDIYRPGETVNFSVIVRDPQWKTPGEIPLKFKFLLPNGKELRTFRKTLNEEGAVEGSVDIAPAAITGTYVLEAYTANDVLLGNKHFSIEEFVPDRIKVTATLDKPFLVPGQEARLDINAMNFFGPPAANRNYEAEIQIRSAYFRAKKYPQYNFGIQNPGISMDKVVREGKTDGQGNAVEKYETPKLFANSGLLRANFFTTVFDETGRPVSRLVSADIFTQPFFLGIADDGYGYYPLNQPAKFSLVAVNKDGAAENGVKAVIRVVKHEYRTVLSRSGSYFRYESQKDDKLVSEQTITISGENTPYSFTPRSPGDYELRLSIPGASAYVSRHFYSYGSWGGDNSSFDVNTEGNIDIETDKTVYQPGETAKLLFKLPFSGKMLVTLESDKVLFHRYVNVENRSASLDIKIAGEYLPNAYITATLIKPHGISEIPLTAAHGFRNIKVEEKKRINKVEILAKQSVRSRTQQEVTVKAHPGSYVTLAAVDNGVLQVSDFKTPDPYDYFYASRALEVQAYNLYPLLFPELRSRLSSTGGDGGMDMQKRTNPMPSKRVKIVSYWSGIVKAGSDGQAKFRFSIPQFSGQVRLMAVAYKGEILGASETAITVADPLVISSAIPRFLSIEDSISVPVTLSNTTDKPVQATAAIKVSGPLKVGANQRQQLSIAPHSEARTVFSLASSAAIDTGSIIIEAQALGETFIDETAIGVRPASPLQVLTGGGSANGKGSQSVSIPTNDFLPSTVKYKLVLSRSPSLELGKQLQYLLRYPYGCTEQTISAAFPQLYYGDLAGQMSVRQGAAYNANTNIIEAIRKIKLRQLYNGGLTLWEGGGEEHWWSTVYAGHFLLEAQKAGFDVDKNLLNGILGFINNRLRNKQTIAYYYNRDQQKKIAPKEVAYSLYVLALASRPNVSAMNYYKANSELLSLDSKYLLSAAYAIAGDKKKYREFLPSSFSGEESVAQTGGSFYSDIRDEAIALNALLEVDPENAQIPVMAKHVADKLKERTWYSTQECAFSFLALGKLSRAANAATVTATIKAKGKTIAQFNGKDISLSDKELGGNAMELITSGEGRLYYYWQSEGVSKSGQYTQEDNYIKIRRQFFDRYGRRISEHVFRQNDLVIVQLTLERSFSGNVYNVAMTDILPAGFEIENPRTREIPGMDWIKDASTPVSLDVRDDRINIFDDLVSNKQVYYYAVRAVSPGIYKMGPVAADAMYNGEYHSYHGAGTIQVIAD